MINTYSNISKIGDSLFETVIPLYNYVRNITNPLLTIIFITIAILLGIFGTATATALIKISFVNVILI